LHKEQIKEAETLHTEHRVGYFIGYLTLSRKEFGRTIKHNDGNELTSNETPSDTEQVDL
jgi:hypothetical protein